MGMEFEILGKGLVAIIKSSFKGLDDMVFSLFGEKTLPWKGKVYTVFKLGTAGGVTEQVGVGPAGKRAFILNVPKHLTWLVFNMAGMPLKGDRTSMHFHGHLPTWSDPSLSMDYAGIFPGGN